MDVEFTPDQQALIREAIATGRLHSADEAVKEALGLWEQRERARAAFLASLDEARAEIARGEGVPITQESMRDLAEDVKRRGRERLAAERPASV
jgi:antitoxin ParD1/3/4